MRVTITLEFDDIQPGSLEEKGIMQDILDSCETIQTGFNADSLTVRMQQDSTTDES